VRPGQVGAAHVCRRGCGEWPAALCHPHGARCTVRVAPRCVRWRTWLRRSTTCGRMPARSPIWCSAGSRPPRPGGRQRRWLVPARSSTVIWPRTWGISTWRSWPRPTSMTSTVICCAAVVVTGGAWRRARCTVHSVLHRALVQALRWDWIWINPAAAASPPRVRRAELRPPTPAEVNVLLRVVVDRPLLWCLLRLAATTGARRGQLLALQWRDVDLGRGVIAFTRALVVGPDGPVLGATKTDATHCTDLDAESAEGLRRCRAAAEQRAAEAGVTLPGAGFVFSDDADGRRSTAVATGPGHQAVHRRPTCGRPAPFSAA